MFTQRKTKVHYSIPIVTSLWLVSLVPSLSASIFFSEDRLAQWTFLRVCISQLWVMLAGAQSAVMGAVSDVAPDLVSSVCREFLLEGKK